VVGVATNQSFHLRLLADPAFRAGEIDIQFLDRRADLIARPPAEPVLERLAVAAALAEDDRRRSQKPVIAGAEPAAGAGAAATGAWTAAGRREGLR
jgi:acetyl/propionyl-CoA carboxylase alpha subunit